MKNSDKDQVVAYIGLGSNLENPAEQINSAHAAIAGLNDVEELAFSSLYHSPPMGPQDQPDYINAVMAIATNLPAMDLLRSLQHIEHEHGRVRKGERWGARTLDLDLLIYGEQQIDLPELTVPHVGVAERAFVLYPLYEIAPELLVPGKGHIADLIRSCPLNGLERLA
ncbi:2-amino-4-hydroxy-6-hydroxymethyldihydropteridine diphosphokinase [Methylobacter marinus]|jgi:2-amino-4-hydroxy-6-hydroxymethyldihydropteridine diphosphokinase|uniref:2-amino-4-hydroxy-6- hydroxymethyldihydropteridine diphosphokinase n=1 Tax=Methylobacter marinus TaxID=34058 RepID=UPI00036E4EFE|nr:2-amino-4-hydroxy-6-hydroxymethyldihydropteridine diphosphokinase [Methylobacter marinus]